MVTKKNIAQYLSVLIMTGFTVVSILNHETTIFYLLYLFWADVLIKTIFDQLRLKLLKFQNQPQVFANTTKTLTFFLLAIYFVFITLVFGLVMSWSNTTIVKHNLAIFLFNNSMFNGSVFLFILRELYLFINHKQDSKPQHLVSNSIIVLHLSIIFGVLFWFLSAKKIVFLAPYTTLFTALPFLLLKLFYELKPAPQTNPKNN